MGVFSSLVRPDPPEETSANHREGGLAESAVAQNYLRDGDFTEVPRRRLVPNL